ncbi:transglycosylase SLT domain-containing protein [Enterovirga sp.]|uniref:transglycosylase SLT domain-containing protein n=1 Tax=Enterovirga sp. TaxID=2026350 RepID=UPI002CD73C84|nr:transglycosylase SLT domain-containing protein [Enterovirga sp.]HMO29836.1 transglycosylase SLT domain-containing protein [Enterovirga sp.]
MRSWSQGRFECARALNGDTEILWLAPRSVLKQPESLGVSLEGATLKAGRIAACVVGGLAVSMMMPGTALAPIAQARASLDAIALPALPEITVSVPAAENQGFADARAQVEQFLRFGNREVPRPLVDAIVRAAAATKVDPIYLMALADKESAFQPSVKAPTSSAKGLYQFIDRTWLDVVRRFGADHGLAAEAAAVYGEKEKPIVDDPELRTRILRLRDDPYLSAVMAAEMLKKDAEEIGLKIGRPLTTTEMYLAHFLGIEDAARFIALREEKTPPTASQIFPAAARANVAIFYGPAVRTGGRRRRGRWTRPGLTIPQVYDKIQGMIDARLERFTPIKTYAAAWTQ